MTEEPNDPTPGAATYVFCVVQATRAPSLQGAPPSLPGAGPIRLLAIDRGLSTPTRLPRWGPRLWAVVCDAPLSHFSSDRIEGHLQDLEQISKFALAHASAIEFFFRRAPVVPLKLFTLFSSDERAVSDLRRRRDKLKRLLKQVQGREEWGVRVTIAPAPPASRAGSSVASGREYLETKKHQRDRKRTVPREASKTASSLFHALGKLASSVSRQAFPPAPKGRPLVAGASFLVPVGRRAAWRKRVAQASAALTKSGSQLDLTGPWPPYHFVTETRRR